jgi:hypothetical protein
LCSGRGNVKPGEENRQFQNKQVLLEKTNGRLSQAIFELSDHLRRANRLTPVLSVFG